MTKRLRANLRPLGFLVLCLASLLLVPAVLFAQEDRHQPASTLRALLEEGPSAVSYTDAFRSAVSEGQIETILESLRAQLGAFQGVEGEANPFTLRFANGSAQAQIVLDDQGAVAGLRFSGITVATATIEEAVEQLAALPGEVSVILLREGREVAAHRPDVAMAVGSAFKLAALRAAEVAVADGRSSWDRVLRLADHDRSLPTGIVQKWPTGSYLTLDSAAILMISLSDNTATDLLIDHIGRRRVEQYAPNSRPLLTTREFFLLKAPEQAELRERYLNASTDRRRQILTEGVEGTLPTESLFAGGPVHPEIEWFFTTRELARLAGSIERRDLLSVDPGPFDPTAWEYFGYKGGSEPGVLNMTLLFVAEDGTEYAMSATQNRPDAAIDPNPFVGALNSVLYHLK